MKIGEQARYLLISINMMIILSSLAAVYLAGAIIVGYAVKIAPEGYEDENGFNLVWQNNGPEIADVVCVWQTRQMAMA